jgi:hypothetical protein
MADTPKSPRRGLLVLTLTGASLGTTPLAAQGYSDPDPRDPAGRGRPRTGQSDSDPRDRPSQGRARTGISDSDPNDPAGRGRGRTGMSDSDPRDRAGHGGVYRYRPEERR